jgi:hypothetical protein
MMMMMMMMRTTERNWENLTQISVLSPMSRILEKLIVDQLLQEFPTF